MSRTHLITCDQCGLEISDRRYYLSLSAVKGEPYCTEANGVKLAPMIYQVPPLDSDKEFCGPNCLRDWVISKLGDNSPLNTSPDPTTNNLRPTLRKDF